MGVANLDTSGMVGRIYREDYLTILHKKLKAHGLMLSKNKIFFMFSSCKYRGANDPLDVA